MYLSGASLMTNQAGMDYDGPRVPWTLQTYGFFEEGIEMAIQ